MTEKSEDKRVVRAGDGAEGPSARKEMHFELRMGPRGPGGVLFKVISLAFAVLAALAFMAFSVVFVGIIIILFIVIAFIFMFANRKAIDEIIDREEREISADDPGTYDMSEDEWKRVD